MLITCVYWLVWATEAFSFYMPKIKQYPFESTSPPVFLTKFISQQKLDAGRESCMVPPLAGNISSYAGFFTVKKTFTYETNFFFWYFPSESVEPAPVLLYLLGGTGVSSLISVFEGHGPFYLDSSHHYQSTSDIVKLNNYRLTKSFSVLYVDHPAGSGYSFTGDKLGYSYTKEEVASLLLELLRQFFTLFSSLTSYPIYIYGESYSASYVPSLVEAINGYISYRVRQMELKKDCGFCCPPMNVSGVIMCGTFFYPINMLTNYTDRIKSLESVNEKFIGDFQYYEDQIIKHYNKGNSKFAFRFFDKMLLGSITKYPTLFENATLNGSFINYDTHSIFDKLYHDRVAQFIQSSYFRNATNVGNCTFNTDYSKVVKPMQTDIMKKVDQFLVDDMIFHGVRVIIYNGFDDLLIPYSAIREYSSRLRWIHRSFNSSSENFYKFRINGHNYGHYKRYGRYFEVTVYDAGHITSKDQPVVTRDLLIRFVNKNIFINKYRLQQQQV